jgi:hypothetical protein
MSGTRCQSSTIMNDSNLSGTAILPSTLNKKTAPWGPADKARASLK